jgi:hypothetical protein
MIKQLMKYDMFPTGLKEIILGNEKSKPEIAYVSSLK